MQSEWVRHAMVTRDAAIEEFQIPDSLLIFSFSRPLRIDRSEILLQAETV